MKNSFGFFYSFILLLVAGISVNAQITQIQTYFVIQPTSGCNGEWAMHNFMNTPSCSAPTYMVQPFGCIDVQTGILSSSTDTLIFKLCSLPCQLTVNCAAGPILICSTGTFNSSANISGNLPLEVRFNSNTEEIEVRNCPNDDKCTIQLTDITGRTIYSAEKTGNILYVPVNGLGSGAYFIEVYNDKIRAVKKILLP